MTKKIMLCALSILIMLVLLGNVLAGGTLLTPKMVLRIDMTDSGEKEITKEIGVRNDENFPLNVNLDISDSIKDITELEEKEFILKAGEERWINFTLKIKEEGRYYGDIIAVFSSENKQPIGLASQIIVLAEEEEEINGSSKITGQVIGKGILKNNLMITITMLVFLVFIVVIILFFIKTKENIKTNRGKIKPKKSVKKRG